MATNAKLSAFFNLMLFILGNGSCNFEADWCGWHEDSASNDSRWHRIMDEEQATTLEWSWWGEFAKLCQAHLTTQTFFEISPSDSSFYHEHLRRY